MDLPIAEPRQRCVCSLVRSGSPLPSVFRTGNGRDARYGSCWARDQNGHPVQPLVDAGVVVELAQRAVHEASEVLQHLPAQGGEARGEQQAPLAAHVGLDLARILGELQRGIAQAGETWPQLTNQRDAARGSPRLLRKARLGDPSESRLEEGEQPTGKELGARAGPEQVQRLCRGLGNARGGSWRDQLAERIGKDGAGGLDCVSGQPLHRGRGAQTGSAHPDERTLRAHLLRKGNQLVGEEVERAGCHGRPEGETGPPCRRTQALDEGDQVFGETKHLVRGEGRGALGTGCRVEPGQDVPALALDGCRTGRELGVTEWTASQTPGDEAAERSALLSRRPPRQSRRFGTDRGLPAFQLGTDGRMGGERRCRSKEQCPGGEIPVPGDDGLGEPLLARGVHQVVAHLHRVAESLDCSFGRRRRFLPRPSDAGIDEQHREGAECPG